jgi:hypothetical protein
MEKYIKTRFNIGDMVYIPYNYEVYISNPTPYVIRSVTIKIYTDETSIMYEVEQNNIIDYVTEKWVCATNEECIKWCEEHNKMIVLAARN